MGRTPLLAALVLLCVAAGPAPHSMTPSVHPGIEAVSVRHEAAPVLRWLAAESSTGPTPTAPTAPRRGAATFAVATEANGRVDRWGTCRPIPYYVDRIGAPAGFVGVVHRAMRTLHAATGYTFTYAGTTTKGARSNDVVASNAVTVAWSTAAQLPALAGAPVGTTGLLTVNGTILMARVALDRTLLSAGSVAGRQSAVAAVLLHELGHAMGLLHVSDPRELMYPTVHGQTTYAAGDRAGLKRVGATADCR